MFLAAAIRLFYWQPPNSLQITRMPLFDVISTPCGNLGVWKVDEPVKVLMEIAGPSLCIDLESVHPGKRLLEKAAVRALLATMLKLDNSSVYYKIVYSAEGTPSLDDGSYMSISHTDGYVAVYLGRKCPLGVDVETRSPRALRLFHRFCKENASCKGEDYATLCWSAKECVYKVAGRRAADFRESLIVRDFNPQPDGMMDLYLADGMAPCDFRAYYKIYDAFVLVRTELFR